MIISKTPLRISFAGGGTDIPVFYERCGGAVVSSAIDKYVYIAVNNQFDERVRVSYSKAEEASHAELIEHPLVRESMKLTGISRGVFISSIADIPSKGTGLASSSSFTVGLLHALYAYLGVYASQEKLASEACCIEIDKCKEPIGKQDQYAAAYGGFNLIEFNQGGSVDVSPITCGVDVLKRIEDNCILFYTGIARSASSVLGQQRLDILSDTKKMNMLKEMRELAYILKEEIENGNADAVGNIMHHNWMLKKCTSSAISSKQIDKWYDRGINAGAIGGKLLGAGGGGFMLFYAPKDRHEAIEESLKDMRKVDVSFDRQGSKIIFYNS